MILVTSSRKPAPRVRRLCRDLAFAVRGEYRPRGKAGLSDPLFSRDTVLILGSRGSRLGLQLFSAGEEVADISFGPVEEGRRAGPLRKGLLVGDPRIFSLLSPHLPVEMVPEMGAGILAFDGIQGRTLRVVVAP
ncbi:MAG: hypothetical protein LUQ42_02415 [Methanomicrobiales archaeon]|nr:hypothetical protein [Methanomicrobiales archaeon]MDD1651691.1 hypothetical protein [Methanomicrobiales archaeon]MDD1655544.1 hypothetical protein [Methanomicrobiales archaeon]